MTAAPVLLPLAAGATTADDGERLTHRGSFRDPDGTLKAVFARHDGETLEMTLLANKPGVDVYCVPSHHYCAMGCRFCYMTREGFRRPMLPVGPEDLLEALARTARVGARLDGERRTANRGVLLSFMGVGELALNPRLLTGVFERREQLHQLGYEQIAYSMATMMPSRSLQRVATVVEEHRIPLKVHFSLHTPVESDRRALLPRAGISIPEAMEMLCDYRRLVESSPDLSAGLKELRSSSSPVEMHYTLIDGVNDSDRHLAALLELQARYLVPLKFLHFNPNPGAGLHRSRREQAWLDAFAAELPHLPVEYYDPPGHAIGASCGEFTKHFYFEHAETAQEAASFQDWQAAYRCE